MCQSVEIPGTGRLERLGPENYLFSQKIPDSAVSQIFKFRVALSGNKPIEIKTELHLRDEVRNLVLEHVTDLERKVGVGIFFNNLWGSSPIFVNNHVLHALKAINEKNSCNPDSNPIYADYVKRVGRSMERIRDIPDEAVCDDIQGFYKLEFPKHVAYCAIVKPDDLYQLRIYNRGAPVTPFKAAGALVFHRLSLDDIQQFFELYRGEPELEQVTKAPFFEGKKPDVYSQSAQTTGDCPFKSLTASARFLAHELASALEFVPDEKRAAGGKLLYKKLRVDLNDAFNESQKPFGGLSLQQLRDYVKKSLKYERLYREEYDRFDQLTRQELASRSGSPTSVAGV